jgi:uncharacterized protein YchJ
MAKRGRPDVKAISPQGHVRIVSRTSKKGLRYKARVIAENHESTVVSDEPINSHEKVIVNVISAMQTFGGTRVLVEDRSKYLNDGDVWYWLDANGNRESVPFQETDTEKY